MSNVYIVYSIITLVLFIIIGFCSYIAYDYFTYKNNLNNSLKITTEEINNNFDISSSNLGYVGDATQINKKNIEINRSNLSLLDNYSSNASNVISMSLNDHKQTTNNSFNNFNDNLNKYFAFNDGTSNISSSTTNNKIFNYIFGTSIPNVNLIAQTTAMSGLTVNSDVGKELLICGSNINKDKCIKMMTDTNGNFNISPAGTSNIKFMSNTVGGINNTMINFDTANNKIFLGGDNETLSKMYITNEGVYVKDLYFISEDRKKQLLINNYTLSRTVDQYIDTQDFNLDTATKVDKLMQNFDTTVIAEIYNLTKSSTLPDNTTMSENVLISTLTITINIPYDISIMAKNELVIDTQTVFNLSSIMSLMNFVNNDGIVPSIPRTVETKYINYSIKHASNELLQKGLLMYINNTSDNKLTFHFLKNNIIIPKNAKIILEFYNEGSSLINVSNTTTSFVFNTKTKFIQ